MKRLFKVLTNKFLLTGAAFLVWMLCFDQNNWASQNTRKEELKETERNISYLKEEISGMEKEYNALKNDPATLEKYAREKYKMKKDNEDLYIIAR
jgi:cell division protein DivIC